MKNIYIITGTTQGIGKGITEMLLENSENIVFGINRRKTDIRNNNYCNYICDLSNLEDIEEVFNQVLNKTIELVPNKIILINNAGTVNPVKLIHNAELQEIQNAIELNLTGVILLSSLFIKSFSGLKIEKIVFNISSGAAEKPMAGWGIYTACKSALEMFTKSVALEQSSMQNPVKLVAFQPGKVETSIQEFLRKCDKSDLPNVDAFIQSYIFGQNYSPQFIGKMIVKLIDSGVENGIVYKARDLANQV